MIHARFPTSSFFLSALCIANGRFLRVPRGFSAQKPASPCLYRTCFRLAGGNGCIFVQGAPKGRRAVATGAGARLAGARNPWKRLDSYTARPEGAEEGPWARRFLRPVGAKVMAPEFHGLREAHGLRCTRGYSPTPLRGDRLSSTGGSLLVTGYGLLWLRPKAALRSLR